MSCHFACRIAELNTFQTFGIPPKVQLWLTKIFINTREEYMLVFVLHHTALSMNEKAPQNEGLKTPDARFELATNGLTVRCSTAELIRNNFY